jgi:hypothetical protein
MTDIAEPAGSRSPRRTIVITLIVLALVWFAFPASVASWMSDNCIDQPYCPPLQSIADTIDAASRSIGIAGAFEAARDNLRAQLGIDFY